MRWRGGDKQTDRETETETNRQTDRQTDRQTLRDIQQQTYRDRASIAQSKSTRSRKPELNTIV